MISLSTISYSEARGLSRCIFIDMRSRGEFLIDHIPGAANVPLFSDEERALIGTIYHKEGISRAIDEGIEITKQNVQSLLQRFLEAVGRASLLQKMDTFSQQAHRFFECPRNIQDELTVKKISPAQQPSAEEGPIVIYCFRGGLRSRSFIYFLREIGIPALHLEGGYKGYRKFVLGGLEASPLPPVITLQGHTGAGKTRILQALSPRFPDSILDLEELAGHRSSILGAIGKRPNSKKMFDSLLFQRIGESQAPFFLVEGESRKIGDIEIPMPFYQAMEMGTHILIDASRETRARLLVEEYITSETVGEIASAISTLESRIGKKPVKTIIERISNREYEEAARILLERYYDPLYSHTLKKKTYSLRVSSENLASAVEEISEFLKDFLPPPGSNS